MSNENPSIYLQIEQVAEKALGLLCWLEMVTEEPPSGRDMEQRRAETAPLRGESWLYALRKYMRDANFRRVGNAYDVSENEAKKALNYLINYKVKFGKSFLGGSDDEAHHFKLAYNANKCGSWAKALRAFAVKEYLSMEEPRDER